MPELNQRLLQKLGLKIIPAQMQLAKLCELPNQQLGQLIKEEMESNPTLEADMEESMFQQVPDGSEEGTDNEQPADDDTDFPIFTGRDDTYDKREPVYRQNTTFREVLLAQLGVREMDAEDRKIAENIIGNLEEDGYLRRTPLQLSDDLMFIGINASEEDVERMISLVQKFDPPGIAARNLQECLLLQVERKMQGEVPGSLKLAYRILKDGFDEFSRKNFQKLEKKLDCTDEDLRKAMDEILRLNPKPGGSSAEGDEAHKVTPDFFLEMSGNRITVTLNSGEIPELRLSKVYLEMLEKYKKSGDTSQNREALAFIRNKIGSAKSFMEAIRQRNATLMAVMNVIVELQKDYFLSGGEESALRPMILKDIADVTGLDVSTVSRVANSKYVETWFGILAVRDLFSGAIKNVAGEEISVEEVKSVLREIIGNEDKKAPLSDDVLVGILEKKGYPIARRTVAKYRMSMGIPVARLRREI